jgi:CheY-like chemotaxis protein
MELDAPVLVVDDDEDNRETIATALEAVGHPVASVGSGVEALRWIEAHGPPSLILLDMMMPQMDGEELLNTIHHDDGLARVPVVIMSGHVSGREKAKELSASGCLVKPFELVELEVTVERFARHHP